MGKRKVEHPYPLPPPKKRCTQMTISELPQKMLVKVLRQLSMDDLKNTRMVDKKWSQVAVAPMREKSLTFLFLSLDQEDYLDDLYDDLSRCKGDFPLDKFFIYLLLKIDKTKTDETRSSDLVPKKEFSLDSLFEKISPFVTELSLGLVGIGNNLKAENLRRKRELNYPKLKYLNIIFESWSQTEYRTGSELWNGYMDFVREIVAGAPKLERIIVKNEGVKDRAIFVQLIKDVFPNGEKINLLTKIDVLSVTNPPFDYFDWTALTAMGLNLRQMELNLSRLVLSNDLLRTFLENQSKSLMNLKLRLAANWIAGAPSTFELPGLEKLEVLKLEYDWNSHKDEFDDNEILITFPDIDYQKRLPSLKQLHLDDGMPWQDFLKEGLAPLQTLEELRFSMPMNLDGDAAAAARIREIFPNLKRLQIYDDLAMGTAVFQNLPHLEELTLVVIDFDRLDEIITGLTKAERSGCERLSPEMLQKLWISKANRKSLGCLQSLHTLRIRDYDAIWGGGIIPVPASEEFSLLEEYSFSTLSMAALSAMDSLKRIDFFGGETFPPSDGLNANEKEFLETLQERFVVL